MLRSLFRDAERELILSYLEEWDGLKGRSKERDEQGDLFSPRDRLVDNIIKELFERFPERDIGQQPDHPLAFQPMDRDKLHTVGNVSLIDARSLLPQRVKQFLYNMSARGQPREASRSTKIGKHVSVLSLFKQRYADRILDTRNKIDSSREPTKQFRAYNRAVQIELEHLREEESAAYEELQNTVNQLRASADIPFERQAPEVQAR
jgi:hypothetical protein